VHAAIRELYPVHFAGVDLGLFQGCPTEHRHKLMCRRAVLRRDGRPGLAETKAINTVARRLPLLARTEVPAPAWRLPLWGAMAIIPFQKPVSRAVVTAQYLISRDHKNIRGSA
jgi:hypothetical protein